MTTPGISSLSLKSPPPTVPTEAQLAPAHNPKIEPFTPAIPAHRSHSPTTNLKQSSPFQFGSRYLTPTDNPYEFNAWDHVDTDPTYKAHAESQYTLQRASPVSPFDVQRFNTDPAKWWNKFYTNNTSNFFKDRKWLHQEFPILSRLMARDSGPARILEVGAGAGNTAFPILAANENPDLVIHACDFSKKAVELILSSPSYSPPNIQASVWDISSPSLPLGVEESSIDVVLLVFIFSALSPRQWRQAVRNVNRVLKPGGEVCFRDYGRGDLAQVRFRKGRWMEENFYVRGDGTRVYFFEEGELRRIWGGKGAGGGDGGFEVERGEVGMSDGDEAATEGEEAAHEEEGNGNLPPSEPEPAFEIVSLGVDRRLLVNRQKQLKMYRCWMQGRFRKPDTALLEERSEGR